MGFSKAYNLSDTNTTTAVYHPAKVPSSWNLLQKVMTSFMSQNICGYFSKWRKPPNNREVLTERHETHAM
jgi:hypothetical protein